MSQISVDLGATPHHLTLTEARILSDLLSTNESAGAVALDGSVREAIDAAAPRPIRLGLDDIAALRNVLHTPNFGGFPGLVGLQTALRREEAS